MESVEFTSEALSQVQVRAVERSEEARDQEQMARYHYLVVPAKTQQGRWYNGFRLK